MLETQLSIEVIRSMTGKELQRYLDAVSSGLFIAEYYADQLELVESILGHLNSMSYILEELACDKIARNQAARERATREARQRREAQKESQPCSNC